jgi:hypothetical protein
MFDQIADFRVQPTARTSRVGSNLPAVMVTTYGPGPYTILKTLTPENARGLADALRIAADEAERFAASGG